MVRIGGASADGSIPTAAVYAKEQHPKSRVSGIPNFNQNYECCEIQLINNLNFDDVAIPTEVDLLSPTIEMQSFNRRKLIEKVLKMLCNGFCTHFGHRNVGKFSADSSILTALCFPFSSFGQKFCSFSRRIFIEKFLKKRCNEFRTHFGFGTVGKFSAGSSILTALRFPAVINILLLTTGRSNCDCRKMSDEMNFMKRGNEYRSETRCNEYRTADGDCGWGPQATTDGDCGLRMTAANNCRMKIVVGEKRHENCSCKGWRLQAKRGWRRRMVTADGEMATADGDCKMRKADANWRRRLQNAKRGWRRRNGDCRRRRRNGDCEQNAKGGCGWRLRMQDAECGCRMQMTNADARRMQIPNAN